MNIRMVNCGFSHIYCFVGHNSSDVSEEAEIERAAGFIAGEVNVTIVQT